jgi:transcriptional regulator with XRE-family HTH domain
MLMSLEIFGRKLRQLRKQSGLTQAELARRLPASTDLISIWERAYQHKGRHWQPDRESAIRLAEIFVDHLTPAEAQGWIALAGYRLGQTELQKLFPTYDQSLSSPLTDPQISLKPWAVLPDQRLFGVGQPQKQLRLILEQASAPWVMAVDGIGGIGKTSLATALVREVVAVERFCDIAWVSAKQEEFWPQSGAEPIQSPIFTAETLISLLLEQLDFNLSLAHSDEEKKARLTELLKRQPYLIVIDNLETVADYETLLPTLRQLANPSKFLLTSRHSLHAYPDVFCFSLQELNQVDTFALLNHEAEIRGVTALANASADQLARIYEVVGGNPLALKLVVGQVYVLPLSRVLENLKEAQSKTIDDLYTYIYWQAWQALDEISKEVLLMMPLAQGGTFAQLTAVSKLRVEQLDAALENLVRVSLVEVGDDIEQHRYRIHRLTETFLLREVIKWQAQP